MSNQPNYYATFASSDIRLAADDYQSIVKAAKQECINSGVIWEEVKILNWESKFITSFTFFKSSNNQRDLWRETFS